MSDAPPELPITAVLEDVFQALKASGLCVLQAPPGAGKTTSVPLHLAKRNLCAGKILMLEPRRVAARGAAERLAENLGEKTGETVGYRMRGESVPGRKIEVVTEGILTRMIQSDPELKNIGCVIFDEFHERSLQADLGLALCLDIRGALRDDLKLLIMSATLNAAPIAALLGDAPVITAEGRSFEVETRWLEKPVSTGVKKFGVLERATSDLVQKALAETEGGVLVFLPGRAEIARVAGHLKSGLPNDVVLMELHGSMPFKAQRQALLPLKRGRKIVLSTAIAETSLTIPDIRVVVDAGRARRARFDPGNGMSRLITEKATRAEATQRTGRAGRVAPGWCYRLWTKGEEGALAPFPPAEIEVADLSPLAMEIAAWGVKSPDDLALLTQPNTGNFLNAQALLQDLGALDATKALTAKGKRMAAIPAHPRLAAMMLDGGGRRAAMLAAILENRDFLRSNGRPPVDITPRIKALEGAKQFEENSVYTIDRGAYQQTRDTLTRLQKFAQKGGTLSDGAMLSRAYPDRIALRRPGQSGRYLMSGGTGALLPETDDLQGQQMIVASDLDGARKDARIRRAVPVDPAEIREVHNKRLKWVNSCVYNRKNRKIDTKRQLTLGALTLEEEIWKQAGDDDIFPALLEALRDLGLSRLNWGVSAVSLRDRIEWLRARGSDLPDSSDENLLETLEIWLGPWLSGVRQIGQLKNIDTHAMLAARLTREQLEQVEYLAPTKISAPTGTGLKVDYSGDSPSISVRLQEMFGLKEHPKIGPDRLPLVIELLSPARRPVQKTSDLPAFWDSSYNDVRKDMRGRYPKHSWPENPRDAVPTRRIKSRESQK